jgi:hypothetical protein
MLFCAIVWSLTGPTDRPTMMVGAAGLPPGAEVDLRAIPVFQETGYAVADGPIGAYFVARGGVRTFGPPVSNAFPLLGSTVQIFRNHILKVEPTGAVSTVDLFALGAIPFRRVGDRIIPEVDPTLVATAPVPGTPDYAARVQAFIKANAPDQWEGLPVGFYQAFVGTVRYEDAFPSGGERTLLSGFSHEVWGLPVSRPLRDAHDPAVVLLRWERGVMAWSRQSGSVTTVPLGEAFKAVLIGEGLDAERTAAVAGSPFFRQLDPSAPGGVARPGELPGTLLADAFSRSDPSISAAAQVADPWPTPTPQGAWYVATAGATPYQSGGFNTVGTPTPTPFGYVGSPGNVPPGGFQSGTPSTGPQAPGMPGSAVNPGASGPGLTGAGAGSDPCYQDEQITYAPSEPRANNELLIAVTSSRPHPYGRLAGTEKTTFIRERAGQLGYVWEWTVALSYPGQHQYTFYVDSTIPCKSIEIAVRQSLATKTPTLYTVDSGNNNGNSNNNSNDNNTSSAYAPVVDPASFVVPGQDLYNCSNFGSQSNAQRVLRYDPSDPNRLDSEDGVSDGIACTTYPYSQYPDDRDFGVVAVVSPTATATALPAEIPTATPTLTAPPTSTPSSAAFDPVSYLGQGDRYGCLDFTSQANAQAVLRADPSDPNRLDTNPRDGLACGGIEATQDGVGGGFMPPPFDTVKVARP